MDKNYALINLSREKFQALLKENGYRCNAEGREFMAKRVQIIGPRQIEWSTELLNDAEKLGGLEPGICFEYPNAQGGISTARVCSLYNLPKDMVNPYLYVFSGHMLAPFYAVEALRFYVKQTGELLPFVSSGKEGNKGLFKKLYDRDNSLICMTEYISYTRIMSFLTSPQYAFENYQTFEDTDSAGNLSEMYRFAQMHEMKEITLVICSGNPFYDKRLLAEWMWQLKDEKYADVRINLVLAHCPLFYTLSRVSIPESRISEIFMGYIAASIGPLAKDTISFNGITTSAKPERYLMPGVSVADWEKFRDLIVNYSNMGWPDYQEILYGVPHEEAVANVILADLFARASFAPGDYDFGLSGQLFEYQRFIGGPYDSAQDVSLVDYLRETKDEKFFL